MMPFNNCDSTLEVDSGDVVRILIATDIHLGYAEKHLNKGEDSFTTFEEILAISHEEDVDCILLGGDLFHENKPSRDAVVKCMDLLRKYVMGDRQIDLEPVSNPEVDFAHCSRKDVNYASPDMNIYMPIFSIHGNHDDPTGQGARTILDELHIAGLINYFGRITNLENVEVSPMLFKKGRTKFALYGMSSVKDERLHRLYSAGKVRMVIPEEDSDEWFNILVTHQNRAKHGEKNYIPEHFLWNGLDLVFWGHEHECRIDPEVAASGGGDRESVWITQPGSSVATSLCEGESRKKCVGVLEIHKKDFKIKPIELQTVRPMLFKTIDIENSGLQLDDHLSDKVVQGKVEKYLKSVVDEMLETELDNLLTGHPKQPVLPQVRLRVGYTHDNRTLLPGKFGNNYHEKVANPSEILLFRKNKVRSEGEDNTDFAADVMDNINPSDLGGSSMEDLLSKYFSTTDDKNRLKLLSTKGIASAVKSFIEKDDKDAVAVIVQKQLEKAKQALIERGADSEGEEEMDMALDQYHRDRLAKNVNEAREAEEMLGTGDRPVKSNNVASDDDVSDDDDDIGVEPRSGPSPPARGRGSKRGARVPRGGGRGSRGTGRGRGATANGNNSILNAFARQSQSQASGGSGTQTKRAASSRKKTPVVYDDDSE